MTDRAEFIAGVTVALGRTVVKAPLPDAATTLFETVETAKLNADRAKADATDRSIEMTERMAESAEAIGWMVHHADNPEDAADVIANICTQQNAKSVLRSAHGVLTDMPLDSAITSTGATLGITEHTDPTDSAEQNRVREQAQNTVFKADVGVTGVDHAIAETGTVVLRPRRGVSRLVSLAPPTHIAVLRPGEVLESLDELFAIERDDFLSGEPTGSMNLISGPSKTGDIEGTIVTGIHGPLEVHLVILANT
jgi:L-lactate dehydrogenase complex protein LldG